MGRRIGYGAVVVLALAFYAFCGTWFPATVLLAVLALPWLSLLLSVPAIATFRVEVKSAEHVRMFEGADAQLLDSCGFPTPPFQGELHMQSCITGKPIPYTAGEPLPTGHCGGIRITVERARVWDYMGLFSFPVRSGGTRTVLVRPEPVPIRPSPVERTPVPQGAGDRILLTMDLCGTPEELDRKLGRFLWLGQAILAQGAAFEACVMTRDALRAFGIASAQELKRVVDELLCVPATDMGSVREQRLQAQWQYYIGGEPDER